MAVMYLPDTNARIAYIRRKDAALLQRFQQVSPADIALCSFVLAELLNGVYHSPPAYQGHNMGLVTQLRLHFISLPFDDRAADEYGMIRAQVFGEAESLGPRSGPRCVCRCDRPGRCKSSLGMPTPACNRT